MFAKTKKLKFSNVLMTGFVLTLGLAATGIVAWSQGKTVTVEGYVIDSACSFTKGLEKPISRECALACAKAGSQLVIQTNDGVIYWPIDDKTPASGQNAKLLEYAGGRVKATGKLYDRGGSHALVIEKMEAASKKKLLVEPRPVGRSAQLRDGLLASFSFVGEKIGYYFAERRHFLTWKRFLPSLRLTEI